MSEAPDAFETEFAAARDAERDDEHEEAHVDGADAVDGGGEIDEAAAGADDGDGRAEPVQAEADKIAKRLRDTQRALKAERRERQAERAEREKLAARLTALERGGDTPADPQALLARLREDDDDPIGDIQTVKALAKLLVGQTQEERQAEDAVQRRANAMQTISNTMREYEDDFREQFPDYDKAAEHFMRARAEELKDTGLQGKALTDAMQNDFAGIVTRSVQAGKDPAEIIYNMAKRRGYAAAAAGKKLETIARGQGQGRSLPAGGGTANADLTAAKVANLKGAAFDAAFEKLRANEKRR
jgi:hypothetical protein